MASTRSRVAAGADDRYSERRDHARSTPAANARTIQDEAAGIGDHAGARVEQLIPELFDGHNRVGQHRHFFAQPAHVHVDRARAAGVGIAPHVRQQQIARQHAAAMLHQVLQQQEFLGGELDLVAVDLHDMAVDVHRQHAVGQAAVGRRGAMRAAQQRADAGHHFVRAERLGDVVVGAELEPDDAIGFLGLRRQHDDRDRRGVGVGPDRAAQLQAVEPGQHQVEHHQVGRVALDLRHDVAPGRDQRRQEAGLAQVVLEQAADIGIVFGDEDPCGRPH